MFHHSRWIYLCFLTHLKLSCNSINKLLFFSWLESFWYDPWLHLSHSLMFHKSLRLPNIIRKHWTLFMFRTVTFDKVMKRYLRSYSTSGTPPLPFPCVSWTQATIMQISFSFSFSSTEIIYNNVLILSVATTLRL